MDDGCQMFGGITCKKLETSIGYNTGHWTKGKSYHEIS